MPGTNANNDKNVGYGKFKTGGYFFVAPHGTTLPTDNSSPLDPAFVNMGFMGDDGFSFDNSVTTNTAQDANGDTIASDSAAPTKTMTTTFREIKAASMKVVYGSGNVTDEDGLLVIHDKGPNNETLSAVLEILLKNGRKDRKVIETCSPNQLGSESVVYNSLVGKQLTWAIMKGETTGDYIVDYVDSTETSAPEETSADADGSEG